MITKRVDMSRMVVDMPLSDAAHPPAENPPAYTRERSMFQFAMIQWMVARWTGRISDDSPTDPSDFSRCSQDTPRMKAPPSAMRFMIAERGWQVWGWYSMQSG